VPGGWILRGWQELHAKRTQETAYIQKREGVEELVGKGKGFSPMGLVGAGSASIKKGLAHLVVTGRVGKRSFTVSWRY